MVWPLERTSPTYCWSMIFSENRYPLFGIMLYAGLVRGAGRSVGTAGVVVAQKLISNERIRVAGDQPVARDHVAGLHGRARTEAIDRIRLRIIDGRARLMPGLGGRRDGGDQRGQRDRSCERHLADEYLHFTLHLTVHAIV